MKFVVKDVYRDIIRQVVEIEEKDVGKRFQILVGIEEPSIESYPTLDIVEMGKAMFPNEK